MCSKGCDEQSAVSRGLNDFLNAPSHDAAHIVLESVAVAGIQIAFARQPASPAYWCAFEQVAQMV